MYRLRQEFGIVNKLKKESVPKNDPQNVKSDSNPDYSDDQIIFNLQDQKSHLNYDKIKEIPTFVAKNIKNQNQPDCTYTKCDCPRCRNMNGN